MTELTDFEDQDALGLAALVATGEVSPAELLEAAIARAEGINPRINAIVRPMYDEARRAVEAGLAGGPFRGVPFLLKDLHAHYAGVPTTNGSAFFKDFVPDRDSNLTKRYREAGLVIFGKTSTPELGLNVSTEPRLFGKTRNPWNLGHTAGGSSGGAAAAVAAGIVPAAHATDGGGSIRIPASCCGLFGLKPTRARTPLGPFAGEGWNGMSSAHAITRSVRDSAALLDVTEGADSGAPYWAPPPDGAFLAAAGRPPGALRVALMKAPPSGAAVDPECVAAVEGAARLAEALGHHVEDAQWPVDYSTLGPAIARIIGANVARTLAARAEALGREVTRDDVERSTWAMAEMNRTVTAVDYIAAVQTIHNAGREIAAFFETYDVILTPTLAKPPLELGVLDMMSEDLDAYIRNLTGFTGFSNIANATGIPAMSVPLHWSDEGLPIGVQFLGPFGGEGLLFSLAGQIEEAQPWAGKRPPHSVKAEATAA